MYRELFYVIVLGFLTSGALGQSQFNRYLGILKHKNIEQDQLAKLDFIFSGQTSSEFKLRAVLTLYFGDYESNEYVSYHFNSVTYNLVTGNLILDQSDQEVTFLVDNFSNGQLTGRLTAISGGGETGILEMTQKETVAVDRPLVQPLWGEYRGTCEGVNTVLQVQTQRTNEDSSRMGNPFGTFEITAQLAEVGSFACERSTLCVIHTYSGHSYNFFKGELDLTGRSRDLNCKVKDVGMECGGCFMRRTSKESAPSGLKSYPVKAGGFTQVPLPGRKEPAAAQPATTLSGKYYGYLFHERLGLYQPVSLNIVTYQGIGSDGNSALFISATSSMFFGGFDSPEFVSHKYKELEYPLLAPQIVLERMDGDVDAVIQLTQLSNGIARGNWYSILFGKVGSFELTNENFPQAPTDAPIMPAIAGRYEGADWHLDLSVIREATPISTVNPFYPLNFKGAFRMPDITPNIKIANGVYDFYTGKIAFKLENESIFSGVRLDGNALALKRPTPAVSRPMSSHLPQTFRKISP